MQSCIREYLFYDDIYRLPNSNYILIVDIAPVICISFRFQGPAGDNGPTGDPGRPGKDVSILISNIYSTFKGGL